MRLKFGIMFFHPYIKNYFQTLLYCPLFSASAGMNVKYARLQDPAMQEYLLPMDSAQSLSDPTVPGGPPSPLPPDPNADIERQKAANAASTPPSRGSGARPKTKDDKGRRTAPRRPALDEAVEKMQSPKEKGLEPRYHAFPPKGSWSKAGGAKARKGKAPPIPDDGPPLDAPGRPSKQHGPMIDPEEIHGNNNNSLVAAAAAIGADDPPPELKPRRHPNPFRKNSFDGSEDHQYVNLPEDSEVNVFANV